MSQENVEVVCRALEAFACGDTTTLNALAADDVEWGTTGGFAGIQPVYRGAAALEEWVHDIREAWAEFELSVEEVLYEEDPVVVVMEHLTASGLGSGVRVDMRVFSAFWFRDGQIVKRVAFLNRSEALEAVGLSE
jgi:ketosteroid isomerase-like protein